MEPLSDGSSLGQPALLPIEDFLATAVALVVGAWSRVLQRSDVGPASQEPDITGALWAELWKEKEHWVALGRCAASDPPYIDDEVAQRSKPTCRRPEGRVDIRFLYSWEREGYFSFECKKLDSSQSRAREYVEAGVHRFTSGLYSAGHRWGGLLGFITSADVNECVQIVREYVHASGELVGLEGEWTPETRFGSHPHMYRSRHRQSGHSIIHLLHLFVSF